jgi:hypothetical protein
MRRRLQPKGARRFDQEFPEFRGALVVAPVPDPDEVSLHGRARDGMKDANVRRFMPDPDTLAGKPALDVPIAQRTAIRENSVERPQIIQADRRMVGDHPMVRVVKQQDELRAPVAGRDFPRQLRAVPFVNDDKVRVAQRRVEIQRFGRVTNRSEPRIDGMKSADRPGPVLGEELPDAPRILGLVNEHVVAAVSKFRGDSPKEVGVPMVPVGDQRVVEESDVHRRLSWKPMPTRARLAMTPS